MSTWITSALSLAREAVGSCGYLYEIKPVDTPGWILKEFIERHPSPNRHFQLVATEGEEAIFLL